jgi:hypothetical protein
MERDRDRLQAPGYLIMFIFNYSLHPFKAYCAIWVRRSNFRHQASPRVSPRERTQRRKVELWGEMFSKFCLNADLPFEERRAEDFSVLKIRRLRPGANPRNWVPKASTLPLDHRSHYLSMADHYWQIRAINKGQS